MGVKPINVGYGNFVSADRLISRRLGIRSRQAHCAGGARGTPPSTHPAAAALAQCLSWTAAVVLSAVQPETVAHRLDEGTDTGLTEEESDE